MAEKKTITKKHRIRRKRKTIRKVSKQRRTQRKISKQYRSKRKFSRNLRKKSRKNQRSKRRQRSKRQRSKRISKRNRSCRKMRGGGGSYKGHAQVQFKGKGKFIPVYLDLNGGVLQFKSGGDEGAVLRTAGVEGCQVSSPKSPRKEHEHSLRIDLKDGVKDSKGVKKYIIDVGSQEDLARWKSALGGPPRDDKIFQRDVEDARFFHLGLKARAPFRDGPS